MSEEVMKQVVANHLEASRRCKRWNGDGSDEVLLEAMYFTQRILRHITYMYLHGKYKGDGQEYEEKLKSLQWDLFNKLGPLMQVAQRRDLI